MRQYGAPWIFGGSVGGAPITGRSTITSGRFDTTPRTAWRINAPLTMVHVFVRTTAPSGSTPLSSHHQSIEIYDRYGTGQRSLRMTTSGTSPGLVDGTGSWDLNRLTVAIVTYDGATTSMYDGQTRIVGPLTATGTVVYDSSGFADINCTPFSGAIRTAYLGMWARVLSDAEISSLANNPWQLFEEEDYIFQSVAAAPATFQAAWATQANAVTHQGGVHAT
jgi:hypothetical protein